MPYRVIVTIAALLLLVSQGHAQTLSSSSRLQSLIDSACVTGGTVLMPASLTLTSTLNLTCDPPTGVITNNKPVLLRGAPTFITCNTGASPCIAIGAKTASERDNLSLSDVNLSGPGFSQPGSVGIRILNSGSMSHISHVRIDGFERGIHVQALGYLLGTVNIEDIMIGVPTASTKIAVHIEGMAANIKFINFGLSGQERVLLMDGPGGTGGGVSFNSGFFNTTLTPVIAGIAVSNSDGSIKQLNITNVEDWETACPYLELGAGAWVTMNGIGWTGDPRPADNNPAIHILPGVIAWLKMSNASVNPCSAGTDLIKNESAATMVLVSSSDLYLGKINFTAAGQGAFVGNRCTTSDGSSSFVGVMTNIRSQGNVGTCPAN